MTAADLIGFLLLGVVCAYAAWVNLRRQG